MYQPLKSIILSYTKHPPKDSFRSQHADLLGLCHSLSLWYFLDVSTIHFFTVPTASTTTGLTSVFICHILSISSCKVFVLVFLFDFLQCDVSIWFHSLQEEFNKSLTMMSGLFAAMSFISIDWPVLHNGDVVVFNVQHSLWLMPVPFVGNLDIMIFTNAPVEIGCSLIVPGGCGLYLTSRYNMVHYLFMLWTYSAFALHLLATYYFLVVSGVYCLVFICCQ